MRNSTTPNANDNLNEAHPIQCLTMNPAERPPKGFELAEWAALLTGKLETGTADINPTTIFLLREPG